MDSAIGTKS